MSRILKSDYAEAIESLICDIRDRHNVTKARAYELLGDALSRNVVSNEICEMVDSIVEEEAA